MFSIEDYHRVYGEKKDHYIAEVQIDTNHAIRELLSFIKDQPKAVLKEKAVEIDKKPILSVVSAKKSKKLKKPKKD